MHFLSAFHPDPPAPLDLREPEAPQPAFPPQGQGVTQVLTYFPHTLGREMAVPAFQLPKVEGVTQVLAYLPPTLGRKNGPYAVWFPKVGGTITRKPFFGSRWGRKMASTRYGSPRSGGAGGFKLFPP